MLELFKSVLIASLITSILVLILMLVRKFSRHLFDVRVMRVVWCVILIKLMVPIGLSSPFNVYESIRSHLEASSEIVELSSVAEELGEEMGHVERVTPRSGNTSDLETVKNKAIPLSSYILILWLGGMLVCFVHIILTKSLMHYKLTKKLTKPSGELQCMGNQLAKEVGVRGNINIRLSTTFKTPMVYGLFTHTIVLPQQMLLTLKEVELKQIIIHELCHIKNGDMVMLHIMLVLQSVYWFNPILWYGFAVLRNDLELYCDYKTLRIIGKEASRDYGLLMIRLVDPSVTRTSPVTALRFANSQDALKRRIQMIGLFKKQQRKLSIGVLVIFAILSIYMVSGYSVAGLEGNTEDVGSSVVEYEERIVNNVENDPIGTEPITFVVEPISFVAPLIEPIITHHYSEALDNIHNGVDIISSQGEEIYAAAEGVVVFAQYDGDMGNRIIIEHCDGYRTIYAKCKELLVSEGDSVAQGDHIAYVGSTGKSTGPHLHFEIEKDGETMNPSELIEFD